MAYAAGVAQVLTSRTQGGEIGNLWPSKEKELSTELTQHTLHVREGQEIFIAPLGDIQYTGRPEDISGGSLKAHLAYCQAREAYYVGTGDYVDLMSPSNRARLRGAALYDNTQRTIEDKASELTDRLFLDHLEGTAGRWLGLVHGHHWTDCGAGETTDQRLARLVGSTYLGTCAGITLRFHGPGAEIGTLKLLLHHGTGGGQGAGSHLNKMEKFLASFPGVDAFFMGHTTKVAAAPIVGVDWSHCGTKARMSHRPRYLINTGGWSKAYVAGSRRDGRPAGDYAEAAMMAPAALGGALLKITAHWSGRRWAPQLKVEV